MELQQIDGGTAFDFGRVSDAYAKYRDIYPDSLYEHLRGYGIGRAGQRILDLGSGTAVLPRHLYDTGASFTAADVSAEQLRAGRMLAEGQGMDRIEYHVCSAEQTGLPDASYDVVTAMQCFHYFDTSRAVPEIARVLRTGGLLCRISMEWLPFEDEIAAETERLVLQYNPAWTGGGFRGHQAEPPVWADGIFTVRNVDCWRERLSFSREAWRGRILTCRGVGASLPPEQCRQFDRAFADILQAYEEPLDILHEIQIEIYQKQ